MCSLTWGVLSKISNTFDYELVEGRDSKLVYLRSNVSQSVFFCFPKFQEHLMKRITILPVAYFWIMNGKKPNPELWGSYARNDSHSPKLKWSNPKGVTWCYIYQLSSNRKLPKKITNFVVFFSLQKMPPPTQIEHAANNELITWY